MAGSWENTADLFKEMPQKTSTYHADILAYHVAVNYDPDNRRLNMHVRHMDMEVGGRIWYSEAGLEVSRQERSNPEGLQRICTAGQRAYYPGSGSNLFQLSGLL